MIRFEMDEFARALVERLEADAGLTKRWRKLMQAENAEQSAPEPKFMPVAQYAISRGFSRRTVETLVEKGLPTIGKGPGRRVDVEFADAWIRAQSAQNPDENADVRELAKAHARKPLRRVK